MFIAKTVNDPQSFNKIYKNMYADIDAPKQEQPVPEEKKEEPFTIQGQLKKAQDEISALGDKATVENMAKPLSQIMKKLESFLLKEITVYLLTAIIVCLTATRNLTYP